MRQSDILRFFITNVEPDNWEDTAWAWIVTALAAGAAIALLTLAVKSIAKLSASHPDTKIWSRGATWVALLLGLVPLAVALYAVWYGTRDYYNYIQSGGLFKGFALAWVIYWALAFLGHFLLGWRREVI